MTLKPRWWIGVVIFLAYAVWVFAVWTWRGIDYRQVGNEATLLVGVVQPLGIAAIALAIFNTWAGWWRATLFETTPVRRPVLFGVLLVAMLGFIGIYLAMTDFSAIAPRHIAILALGMALVGFCEEMVTRGVLLVSLRGSVHSEAWAWFGSTALFGLLHATNAFFGVGALALVQVLLAFCAGTGLYLLRRFSGSLLLPMVVHAAWDFSSIADGLDQRPSPTAGLVFLGATYLLSLVFVVLVVRREGKVAVV